MSSPSLAPPIIGSLSPVEGRLDLRADVDASVRGAAVIRASSFGLAKNGMAFATVTLGNASGSRDARIWHPDAQRWRAFAVGDAVQVVARVKAGFRDGPPELDIVEVEPLPATHPVRRELNPRSPVPLAELRRRFALLRAALGAPSRALLDAVLDHVGWEDFYEAPAAKVMHHATIHGLLDHSVEVAEIARQLASVVAWQSAVELDAVTLGALLHDAAKVREYVWKGTPIDISPSGRLRYHTALGSELVALAVEQRRAALDEAGVTPAMVEALQHVIESHHAEREFGSPTAPATLEATIVHLADLVSARCRGWIEARQGARELGDGWYVPPGFRASPRWDVRLAPIAPLLSRLVPYPTRTAEDTDSTFLTLCLPTPCPEIP